MPAQPASAMLLKLYNKTTRTYENIMGVRTRELRFNNAPVDVSQSTSPGRWRELLGESSTRQVALAGDGVLLGESMDARLLDAFSSAAAIDWEIILPSFYRIQGGFILTELIYKGDYNGEVVWEVALESAGQLLIVSLL